MAEVRHPPLSARPEPQLLSPLHHQVRSTAWHAVLDADGSGYQRPSSTQSEVIVRLCIDGIAMFSVRSTFDKLLANTL